MPKRLIDSSYLNSPSLDRCSPRAQDSFPRFILLADDFGCFEVDPRRLLALGWTSLRTDVTETTIVDWLEEYADAGMAALWTENERRFCYLIGWDGPHGQRKRAEYDPEAPKGTPAAHGSRRRTPRPPADLVDAVRRGERRIHDGKAPGTDRERGGAAEIPSGKRFEEILNGSTPAREITGNAAEPRISAAAVPVAVPDPGKAGTRRERRASPPVRGFTEARGSLVAAFIEERGGKYLWQGAKDTEGLKRILGLGVPLSEILDRWRTGLRRKTYPTVSSVAQLASKWNDLEVDAHEAGLRRIRERAEAELAGPGPGDGGDDAAPRPSEEPVDPLPAFGATVSSTVGKLLGDRR